MKASVALLGVLAGLLAGAMAFFTIGEAPAVAVLAVIVAFGFLMAASAPRGLLAAILVAMLVAIAGMGWRIADEAMTVVRAFRTVEGPAAPADAGALASAEARLEGASGSGGFRVDLHEDEISAVIQDGLQEADVPLRRVVVDIVDGPVPGQGRLDFVGEFKSEDVEVRGSILARVDAGTVRVDVVDVEIGALNVPGLAAGAVETAVDDLLARVSDLNDLLAEAEADVQSITIGDDRLIITGTQAGGRLLTSAELLAGLQEQAAAVGGAVAAPPERLGPGDTAATFTEGSVYYVALGDSLAANVGIIDPRDGYVSRLHRQLEERDGRGYGLRNFGVAGETSGTMIRTGQLDAAIEFLRANRAAYVTIDIGANDLLGHLGSSDCAAGVTASGCRERIDSAFATYEENAGIIFSRLAEAAPEATIVFLRAYNPFSLGIAPDVGFERDSSEILDAFNDVGAAAAEANGLLVADGFTPMLNTAAATTRMLESPPDIHPKPIGHDVLAAAILDALP